MSDKIFRIEKLWRGERGKQKGLYVHLYNVTDDFEYEHPHFCTEYHQATAIEELEEAGVGAEVMIKWKKNKVKVGNEDKFYWNIQEVYPTEEGAPSKSKPKSDAPPKQGSSGKKEQSTADPAPDKTPEKKTSGSSRSSGELIRADAFRQSTDITALVLAGSEKMKKSVPSVEAVMQLTLQNASTIEAYIRGDIEGIIVSDDADLDKTGVDADDDFPF